LVAFGFAVSPGRPLIDVMPCKKFVSGTLSIGASVQSKLARLGPNRPLSPALL
jgi:hypothetical protein